MGEEAAGDKVVSRFIMRATHDRGELIGVAPSDRELASIAIFIHRISGGKIAEEWAIGTVGSNLRGQLLEQERIERERVEQELRVARRIQQALLPQGLPQLEGWQIISLLPASQGGRRRPASMVSSIPRALASPTPTPATIYPMCVMVMAM